MTSERVRFFPPIALSFLAGGQVSFGIRLIPGTGLVSPVLLCYARVATEREAEMANVLSHMKEPQRPGARAGGITTASASSSRTR